MARYEGTIVLGDCGQHCPAQITTYIPDLAIHAYTLHSSMFFSTLKPKEVVCT